jgi:peptidoglycan/LPS O-acetylase OafA/YrhL
MFFSLEAQRKFHFPQALRYPFFLIGLVIMIAGAFASTKSSVPTSIDVVIAVVGFAFLVIAIVFR